MSLKFKNKLEEAVEEGRTYKRNCIYQVEDGVIAKKKPRRVAENEFEIGNKLYDNNVNVPEFYDIIELEYPLDLSRFSPRNSPGNHYVLMERVEGMSSNEIPEGHEGKAKELLVEEILKVLELGIKPMDWGYDRNFIYNPAEEKVNLIDFEMWKNLDGEESEDELGYTLNRLYRLMLEIPDQEPSMSFIDLDS